MNKGIIFILDGLGDRPCPQLDGRTPLEAAATPVLDALAARHQSGMMDPLMAGVPVDTHTGVGMLFGLSPAQGVALSRGPIEAAGIGLELQAGDVLWRANLCSVEKNVDGYKILDRRAGRIREDASALCAALQNLDVAPGITADLFPATQHRAVLRLRGDGVKLSAAVSDTDPGGNAIDEGVLVAEATDDDDAARQTAAALNNFTQRAYQILNAHDINQARIARGQVAANGVIVRSAGGYQPLESLLSQLKLKVAAVAGEMTILGLATLLGMNKFSSDKFTSLPDTDLAEKIRVAQAALKEHDLVFVHIKGTDTAAHDKDPQLKADFIARFDAELGKADLDEFVIGVCADHSTDSVRGEHSGDAVPILLCNPAGRCDTVTAYNETACTLGGLGRLTAETFLTSVLDGMGISMSSCLARHRT